MPCTPTTNPTLAVWGSGVRVPSAPPVSGGLWRSGAQLGRRVGPNRDARNPPRAPKRKSPCGLRQAGGSELTGFGAGSLLAPEQCVDVVLAGERDRTSQLRVLAELAGQDA